MKYPEIKKDECIGCGLCEEVLPELFSIKNNTAIARKGAIDPEYIEAAEQLARECPTGALEIKEKALFTICTDSGTEQQ
ncbi:MAG: ferredoxin [Spirochaetales bacterium]|nr:ferredoxin [Spirochaetales bacterium]